MSNSTVHWLGDIHLSKNTPAVFITQNARPLQGSGRRKWKPDLNASDQSSCCTRAAMTPFMLPTSSYAAGLFTEVLRKYLREYPNIELYSQISGEDRAWLRWGARVARELFKGLCFFLSVTWILQLALICSRHVWSG